MSIYATVVGNLGRDPESRQAGSSTVCNFSVATSYGYGDRETTTWVRVAAWGRLGETCQQHLAKGRQVVAVGELHTREHDGKTYVELNANSVKFVGGRGGDSSGGRPRDTGRRNSPKGRDYEDADIPF